MAGKASTRMRNAMVNAAVADIETATPTPAYINFLTSGDVVLVHLHFNVPSFGTGVVGVATMDNDPVVTGTATAAGTVLDATIYDGANAACITEITCAVGSGQIQMSSLSIAVDDVISFTGTPAMTLTQPES